MDKLAELLRQGADKLVNLPTEAQRFVTNPQAFIQLLTGKNPMPRETGFAAGATGLPAQQGTVLDPNYQAYMQGYEQGEPFGYAAMATPAAVPVAKALAPKAGQMAENYMVNQGFMPSIVAYHGTPHTIKGKFDISKVGTGEGAQAYGHGMYFAESPKTAEYYKDLSKNILYTPEGQPFNFAYELSHPNVRATLNKTKDVDSAIQRAKQLIENKSAADVAQKDLQILENLKNKGGLQEGSGNLYKVDIPDADIPNMLAWDKPLREQPEILKTLGFDVKKYDKLKTQRDAMPEKFDIDIPEELAQYNKAMALEKQMREMPIDVSGKYFYESLIKKYGTQKAISEALAEKGIKGIRYLDAGSRGKAAERSSNFVVFEPSQVKILEQNSKPMTRKEILEQELKKVVE
jgi:hypothetical protein